MNEELETAVETRPVMQSVLDIAQEWPGTTRFEKMDNPMILAFRNLFATAKDTCGMRLGSQKFGDKCPEDAFVDRIR